MAVFSGPEIVNNGLVFYYDVSNTQRSWKGKPTINLAPNTNYSNRTYYIVYDIGGWGGDDADVYYYPNSGWNDLPYKKMVKHTGGSGGSYIDEHSFFTLEEGKTYTISCYMKANKTVTVSGHALALNRNSDNQYRVPADFNLTTEWVKQQWTYTCGVGEGGTTYHFRQIIYNDTNLPVEVYWCALQIEEGTYSTPYVNGARSNTQVLIDISGNNNITTMNTLTYYSNNTFSFDGSTSYANTGYDLSWNNTNSASVMLLLKPDTLSIYRPFIGKNDYEWQMAQQNQMLEFVYWNTSGGHTNGPIVNISNFFTSTSQYVHLGVVWNHIDNKMYFYRNGVLVNTSTWVDASINRNIASPINIGGNIYQWGMNGRYWSGKIDMAMMYTRALSSNEISQNFEAIRGRYGI